MTAVDRLGVRRQLREARAESDPIARELLVHQIAELDARAGRAPDRHLLEWLAEGGR